MYRIYEIRTVGRSGIEYFFVTDTYWSGDFHSLQQLSDVGMDDPDKIEITDFGKTLKEVEDYEDVSFLFETDTLDNLENTYPEYFI